MLQTDQGKQASENKLYCELHSSCQVQVISLQEKYSRKSRLLCAKCMIDAFKQQEASRLVCLQDLIDSPVDTILEAINQEVNEIKIDEYEALEEIEKLLVKLVDTIKKQLQLIKQDIQQMRQQVGDDKKEKYSIFQLNDLVQQFELIRRMDSYQGTNELAQLEQQLNQISKNLINTYISAKEKFKDNRYSIAKNYYNNFQIISNEVESTSKITFDLLGKIVSYGVPLTIFNEIQQFPQIHHQISEGKYIQYELLYQGTRDGMNATKYWAKCNQQSNLLTIMTSKNGNKFGGYSPCEIIKGKEFIQDPTMKSFLFQYNKKEIYKIKRQDCAVYCSAYRGPAYGGGCDISIDEDFIKGTSLLGNTYDTSDYNVVDKETHFFGAKSPQLQEIKVFKVIFK